MTTLQLPSEKSLELSEAIEALSLALKEEEQEYNFGGSEDEDGALEPGFVNFARLESLLDKIRKAQ